MRQALSTLFIFVWLLCNYSGFAQTGWKWGIGSNVYGISGTDIETWPTVTDRSGNVFLSGIITGWADSAAFGPYHLYNPYHYTQLIITKADTAGNYQWVIGTQGTNAYPVSMATDAIDNLYLLGKYENMTCVLGNDTLTDSNYTVMCFLAKIDPAGNVVWAKNVAPQANAGGLGIDSIGNIYVTGSFYTASISIGTSVLNNTDIGGGTSGFGGSPEVFVAKYNPSGYPVWAKSFGGDSTDYPRAMAVADNGTVYISGHFYSSSLLAGTTTLANTSTNGGRANFLVKYDSNGNPIWAHTMNEHIDVAAMAANKNSGIYMTGSIDTSIVEGGYFLNHQGKLDVYLSKYNANGTAIWARVAGGNQHDIGNSIAVDLCGSIWISGQMSSVNGISGYAMIFESFTLAEPSWSYDPMFVARYDTLGTYHGSMALPSGGDDESGIAVDNRGNFYLGGDFQTPMTFGPNVLMPTGHEVAFIAKYKYDSVVCHTEVVLETEQIPAQNEQILLYPNPTYDECTISNTSLFATGARAEIYDMMGRYVTGYTLNGSSTVITTKMLQPGMYQCRITTGSSTTVKKLVLMK